MPLFSLLRSSAHSKLRRFSVHWELKMLKEGIGNHAILEEINEPSQHVGSYAHRKRIDHPGLKISAAPAIEKYLDHPGLRSSATPEIEKCLDHTGLRSNAAPSTKNSCKRKEDI
ncbi:hypothetical protein TNCV_4191761 [Trichonephila clavipes]|nr:hypothetical protein TNCV_4191761 [Trichonephila clavipes]